MSSSDSFIQIPTDLFEALCKIRINGESRQVLDVIIRKTIGFHKIQDKIPTSQFTKLTGLHYQAVYKARKKLVEMNIITITQKGDSQILTYSIQSDFTKWKLSPKKVTITQKGDRYHPKRLQSIPKKVIVPAETISNDNSSQAAKDTIKYTIQKKHEEYVSFFNSIWKIYPARKGKKANKEEALNYFLASFKDKEDQFSCLETAVKNYANSEDVKDGIGIKDMIRFLRPGRGCKIAPWKEFANNSGVEDDVQNDDKEKKISQANHKYQTEKALGKGKDPEADKKLKDRIAKEFGINPEDIKHEPIR